MDEFKDVSCKGCGQTIKQRTEIKTSAAGKSYVVYVNELGNRWRDRNNCPKCNNAAKRDSKRAMKEKLKAEQIALQKQKVSEKNRRYYESHKDTLYAKKKEKRQAESFIKRQQKLQEWANSLTPEQLQSLIQSRSNNQ